MDKNEKIPRGYCPKCLKLKDNCNCLKNAVARLLDTRKVKNINIKYGTDSD